MRGLWGGIIHTPGSWEAGVGMQKCKHGFAAIADMAWAAALKDFRASLYWWLNLAIGTVRVLIPWDISDLYTRDVNLAV